MKFSRSRDGIDRISIRVTYRLSVEDIWDALCWWVDAFGPPKRWSKSWIREALTDACRHHGDFVAFELSGEARSTAEGIIADNAGDLLNELVA